MKIAIYGDSFGCFNVLNLNAIDHSWPSLLKQAGHSVSNFSKVGASFYHTFQRFEAHRVYYDVNIVLVTKTGRQYIKDMPAWQFFSSKFDVEKYQDCIFPALTKEEQAKAQPYIEYMKIYFDCPELCSQEIMSRRDMLAQARLTKGQHIFISCFDKDIIPETAPLIDIFNFENIALNVSDSDFGKYVNGKFLKDRRLCHLSEENNYMLTEKILEAIKCKSQTIDLAVRDFKLPTKDFSSYLEWTDQ
jgi:hypothetical protein